MCANNVFLSFFFFLCKSFLSSLKISKGFVFWRFSILRPRNWKRKAVRCGKRRNETKRARRIRERGGGGKRRQRLASKDHRPKNSLSLSLSLSLSPLLLSYVSTSLSLPFYSTSTSKSYAYFSTSALSFSLLAPTSSSFFAPPTNTWNVGIAFTSHVAATFSFSSTSTFRKTIPVNSPESSSK